MSATIPTNGSTYPDTYCRWHYQCEDPLEGARIVTESEAKMPLDFDYSAVFIVKTTKDAYLASYYRMFEK